MDNPISKALWVLMNRAPRPAMADGGLPSLQYRGPDGQLSDAVTEDDSGRLYNSAGELVGHNQKFDSDKYGSWSNPEDQSTLGWLGMKGYDIGEGAYNAVANLANAVSPIGTSEQGNMAFQVPPMVHAVKDSFGRLIGTPNAPGSMYSLSGVPELDKPILDDTATAVLSMFGGNAFNPLTKAPAGSVGMFAGRAAKTADHAALARAEEMASRGVPREQIWNDTGWFKGVDDKWRFEIDDSAAKLTEPIEFGQRFYLTPDYKPKQMQDAFEHPNLYSAYDVMPTIRASNGLDVGSASYYPAKNQIELPGILKDEDARSVILHELQHSIQEAEKFAPGAAGNTFTQQADAELARDARSWRREMERHQGDLSFRDNKVAEEYVDLGAPEWVPSTDARNVAMDYGGNPTHHLDEIIDLYGLDRRTTPYTPREMYNRTAGEVEARAVQKRADLTPEERQARAPWLDYDVPESDQIVKFLSDNQPSLLGSAIATAGDGPAPIRAYHGMRGKLEGGKFDPDRFGQNHGDDAGVFLSSNPVEASDWAKWSGVDERMGSPDYNGANVIPADVSFRNALYLDAGDLPATDYWYGNSHLPDQAARGGHDGVVIADRLGNKTLIAMQPNTVKSATTGETLFSDNKPSIMGSALATAGDSPLPMDHASRMARARELGFDTDTPLYHGTTSQTPIDAFNTDRVFLSPDRGVAAGYAKPYSGPRGSVGEYYGKPGNQADLRNIDSDLLRDLSGDLDVSPRELRYALKTGSLYNHFDEGFEPAFYDALKARGYDSAIINDAHPGTGARTESVVHLNPSDLRSVNAAFDPSRAGEAGLLLSDQKPSILGAAIGTAGEQSPLRAYHGTTHEIDGTLRPSDGARGEAVYFSDSPAAASSYATGDAGNYARFAPDGDHPSVLPVDIHGKLFDENSVIDPDTRRVMAEIANRQLAERVGRDLYPDEIIDPDEFASTYFDRAYQPKGYNVLQSLGYDAAERNAMLGELGYSGVIGPAAGLSGGRDIAMFKPGTVKSATTGETLFSDTGKPNILGSAIATAGDSIPSKGIDVWHGSPHDFDKFDLSKIGTGEGNDAFGRGAYLASNEDVAKYYQDMLAPDGNGYRYQFGINAPDEQFLDMSKPLSEQSEFVRNALMSDKVSDAIRNKYAIEEYDGRYINRSPSSSSSAIDFADAQKWHDIGISNANAKNSYADYNAPYLIGRDPEMSSVLKEVGLPGAKYYDQHSRMAQDGNQTMNYVVYDDGLIDTLHKWRGDEQLYSDTGKPNILGSAVATAGEGAGGKPTVKPYEGAKAALDAKSQKDLDGYSHYYGARSWASEADAKADIARRINKDNEAYNGLFGTTDPSIVDHMKFVKSGNGVKIAGTTPSKRATAEVFPQPTSSAPEVNWRARDMINDGSPESALRNYGRGKGNVIEGYVNLSDLPKEKLAGGKSGYDWSELERNRSAPPPATIRINKNGSMSILDGNHRIHYWREKGYDQIPAFVIDERK